jgi:hypothetical protein
MYCSLQLVYFVHWALYCPQRNGIFMLCYGTVATGTIWKHRMPFVKL